MRQQFYGSLHQDQLCYELGAVVKLIESSKKIIVYKQISCQWKDDAAVKALTAKKCMFSNCVKSFRDINFCQALTSEKCILSDGDVDQILMFSRK